MDYSNKRTKFKINAAMQKETPQVRFFFKPNCRFFILFYLLAFLSNKGKRDHPDVGGRGSQALPAGHDCADNEISKNP
jgi:hypothetical protein